MEAHMSIQFSVFVRGDFDDYAVSAQGSKVPTGEVGYVECTFANPPERQPSAIRGFLAGFASRQFADPTRLPLKVCYPLPEGKCKVVDGPAVRLDPTIMKTFSVFCSVFVRDSSAPGGYRKGREIPMECAIPSSLKAGESYYCLVTGGKTSEFHAKILYQS